MGRKGNNKKNNDGSDKKRHDIILNKNNKKAAVGQLVEKLLKTVAATVTAEDPWNIFSDVYSILEEIRKIENRDVDIKKNERSAEAVKKFIDWLKECGVECSDVQIEEFPELGLGVKACKDYKTGDLVVKIPRKVMMSEERALSSSLGNLVEKDPILKQMPHVALAIFLLFQKHSPDSYWKHYINILPITHTTFLYFTPDDFQYLKGSPAYQSALSLYLAIARQYAYFHKLVHISPHQVCQTLKDHFTFDDYRWAVSTVMTRQNKLPALNFEEEESRKDVPLITALIPLWDLCNHMHGEITTGFNTKTDEAECFALKDFKKDEQICIFYGERNNLYFFLYNGFVFEDNQYDSMNLSLGVSGGDPLCEERKKALERIGVGIGSYTIFSSPQPCFSGELLAIARILSMNKDQIEICLKSETPEKLLEETSLPGLEDVDKAAYSYINTRCKLLLMQYSRNKEASLKEAGEKISEGSQRHRTLIDQLKKSEMKMLQRVMDVTQEKLKSLPTS